MRQAYRAVLVCHAYGLLSGCTGRTDWASTNEGIAAWATFAATVIALVGVIVANRQFRDQVRTQTELERKRIEASYLGQALYIVRSGLKEAQVFISAWTYYKSRRRVQTEEETGDEKAIRREFAVAWRKFDDDLAVAIDVFRAAEGESELVTTLQKAYDSSTDLYEMLITQTDSFASEEAMMATTQARAVVQATDEAAKLLAGRLSEIFRAA